MSETLLEAVDRHTEGRTSPLPTAIEGFTMLRSNYEKPPAHLIFRPALCLVLQGAKWAQFGGKRLDYHAGQALLVSVDMPSFGRVAEASPTEPYLGLIIELDPAVLREVMADIGTPPTPRPGAGMFVIDFDATMEDCALRMVRLLDTPRAISLLYPAIVRELCYWLLVGPHGGEVARMALANSHARRVIAAIHALRQRFAEPVRIGELAAAAHMSLSAFHREFKALTSMTPLQYQKQLRLLEARHLMVDNAANVETAAFSVGYESPSQFSREYSRMFGAPPRRYVAGARASA